MAINRPDPTFNEGTTSGQSADPGNVADQAREQVGQVADVAREQAGQFIDQARQQAFSQIDMQKGKVAESLSSIADALHSTGKQLRDNHQEPVAQFIEQAADQVTRFSSQLSERDIEQQLAEVQHFARRQPALFLGGAFFLGLVAARFFKPPEHWSLQGTETSGARMPSSSYPRTGSQWSGSTSRGGTSYGSYRSSGSYGSGTSSGMSGGTSGKAHDYTQHNVHDDANRSNRPMFGNRSEPETGMPANGGASIEPGVQPSGHRTGRASNLEE